MSNLAQFSGYWTPTLIPNSYEPAYATSGYGQNNVYIYSHNHQLLGQAVWPTSEFVNAGYVFNNNWNSTSDSNSGWQYAGTGYSTSHGHVNCHVVPQADTADGHAFYLTPCYGDSTNRNYGSLTSQSTGVWVNKTKRDNLCLQYVNNGTSYGSHEWGMQIATMGRGAWQNPITRSLGFNGFGQGLTNGYTAATSYGLVGYNETTKMFAVVGNATSSTCALYIYKNVSPPTLANANDATFWDQFDHTNRVAVSFSFPGVSDTADYQHYKIFPLDNGNIAMVYKYSSNNISYYLFTGNNGVNSTSYTFAGVDSISTTTSYHDSNFTNQDSLPAMVTFDGKYVVVFTQYYYYLSGVSAFFIRVSDGQYRKMTWTDSSYCGSFAPISGSSFLYGRGVNNDGGAGQYMYQYDMDFLFSRYPTNGTVVTSYYTQIRANTSYTSTCYGMIWPMISYTPNFIRGIY